MYAADGHGASPATGAHGCTWSAAKAWRHDERIEQKDGNMRFVNESYESKLSEWKLWYRAGKEPVPAAVGA